MRTTTLSRTATDAAGHTVTFTQDLQINDATPAPLVGVDWSTASPPEPNYYTDWPAVRCYKTGHAINAVAAWGSRVVAVTDDPAIPRNGGAAAASTLRQALETFYYGSGSAARKDVQYHFANGNEVDREYTSGTLPANVVDTWRRMYDVCHELNGDGTRRYPNASMWADFTYWQMATAGAGARFKPIAPYIDGWACSLYNPGREQVPVVWTPYPDFADLMMNTAADWGVGRFAIWETGSPIHATDPTKRPAYFEGLLDYVTAGCASRGLTPGPYLYWNRQTTGSPPGPANQFKHDRTQAPDDTATRWHSWTP